jgi:DNA-binding transcriptional ArsR family regulator
VPDNLGCLPLVLVGSGSRRTYGRVPGARHRTARRSACAGILIRKRRLTYRSGVGDVFKALADPTRRTILDELAERNGQTLFELCSRLATKHQLGSSRQAISQHLAVLEDAGLVETRKEGRYKFHDFRTEPLENIAERWLEPRRREDS